MTFFCQNMLLLEIHIPYPACFLDSIRLLSRFAAQFVILMLRKASRAPRLMARNYTTVDMGLNLRIESTEWSI